MNDEHAQQILNDFPRLFRAPDTDSDHSIVRQWGFECGDGWFALIYKLCADIEKTAQEEGIDSTSSNWPRVVQVKEKFGTLRFYIRTPSAASNVNELEHDGSPAPEQFMAYRPVAGEQKIKELIAAAEKASRSICESCGEPGTLRLGGWWHVKCDPCEERYKREHR